MNYELALELKNAGFPQEYKKTTPLMDWAFDEEEELHLLHEDNDTDWWIGNDYNHSDMSIEEVQKTWVKCPTLSELIEACGEGFADLNKSCHGGWECNVEHFNSDTGFPKTTGSTPEEAVAKLWLVINKK